MSVMLQKTMPRELVARGVECADELCDSLVGALEDWNGGDPRAGAESPEDVFRRLGGR